MKVRIDLMSDNTFDALVDRLAGSSLQLLIRGENWRTIIYGVCEAALRSRPLTSQPTVYRAWINQPSRQQAHHTLHGRRCIVYDDGNDFLTIHFTEGSVESMKVHRSTISKCH